MCKRTSAAPLSGTIKPYPFATSNHLTRPDISTRSTASIADSSGAASQSNRREAKFLPSKDQLPPNRARGRSKFAARGLTANKQYSNPCQHSIRTPVQKPDRSGNCGLSQKNNQCGFGATCCEFLLERFPITWNHVIEKESLKCKDLEHGGIEKVEQVFRDMLYGGPAGAWRLGTPTKRPSARDDALIG